MRPYLGRAEYFLHNRAAIGIACAKATALRTHVAPHTAQCLPFPPSGALHDHLLPLFTLLAVPKLVPPPPRSAPRRLS